MLFEINEESYEIENPSDFLKCLRNVLGLSQTQMAERCDVSAQTIKKIEAGSRIGTETMWARILSNVEPAALELAAELTNAATEALDSIAENYALSIDGNVRLIYAIASTGKLHISEVAYNSEAIASWEKYITVPIEQAKLMLKAQKKELGS